MAVFPGPRRERRDPSLQGSHEELRFQFISRLCHKKSPINQIYISDLWGSSFYNFVSYSYATITLMTSMDSKALIMAIRSSGP